jgi:inosine-uridine nucleoside N-ribohydrolase
LDWAEVWFQRTDRITFHDPLAATTIFDDQMCTFEKGRVDVELVSARLQGLTYWDPSAVHSRHEVAVAVNPERFFEHFFSILC